MSQGRVFPGRGAGGEKSKAEWLIGGGDALGCAPHVVSSRDRSVKNEKKTT